MTRSGSVFLLSGLTERKHTESRVVPSQVGRFIPDKGQDWLLA